MYKQAAAYAAGLLSRPGVFTPMTRNGELVWAVGRAGNLLYNDLHMAYQLSLLGAMRAGADFLGTDSRTYGSLDRAVRRTVSILYPSMQIQDLDAQQAIAVLRAVAK